MSISTKFANVHALLKFCFCTLDPQPEHVVKSSANTQACEKNLFKQIKKQRYATDLPATGWRSLLVNQSMTSFVVHLDTSDLSLTLDESWSGGDDGMFATVAGTVNMQNKISL